MALQQRWGCPVLLVPAPLLTQTQVNSTPRNTYDIGIQLVHLGGKASLVASIHPSPIKSQLTLTLRDHNVPPSLIFGMSNHFIHLQFLHSHYCLFPICHLFTIFRYHYTIAANEDRGTGGGGVETPAPLPAFIYLLIPCFSTSLSYSCDRSFPRGMTSLLHPPPSPRSILC